MVGPHTYDDVSLESGIHWCIVCGAVDSELAPECVGYKLTPAERSSQKGINMLQYGADRWVIVVSRGQDVKITTLVPRGINVAPR